MDPSTTRQRAILRHLSPEGNFASGNAFLKRENSSAKALKSDDDVVLVCSLRTPVTKAKKGGLKDTPADDLMATVIKAAIGKTGIDPKDIGDVVFGSVLGPNSQRANEARIAMFFAGMPESVPCRIVNRQCSSGLQAIADVAAAIRAGYYTIGLAGGVETMTANPMAWEGGVNPRIKTNQKAANCLVPMGVTSENVAEKYGITREAQDGVAVRSHTRAAAAQASGRFDAEIVPVHTKVKDVDGNEYKVTVDQDDGIRADVTPQGLAKLPAVFKKGGSTTPGNASQVSDGAAAAVLMTRAEARRRGLPVLGVFRSYAAVGVPPEIMGIGPAKAIPEAVRMAGLSISDIDLFELNEAFASQALYCQRHLGLDDSRVNVNGGAIALGHPLGCTGARCTATLLHEMARRGSRFGVVSMCIGSGMGAAAVFERE
uniref:acetyl-CoA C-acyltransferase n=1 Tax=Tetraselmis sp. GSL018 TaxID=582737 RepID=A0A061S4X0_9CHLO|mmetsp:Transcript_29516/g.70285  ORF Transcript_29516/g.70285 Transcript_29516/m.70285 type:complete len:429 (+) Transcript_29516:157-1443(+)